jgi:macrolide transport system ATP-binding/permease protein
MLHLAGVARTYRPGNAEIRALADINLIVGPGEYVSIAGPSGSGKSTLLHVIGLLDRPDSGAYRLMDRDVMRMSEAEAALTRNRLLGFVFQEFHLLARRPALENVALPMAYAGRGDERRRAAQGLAAVGLAARAHHRPNELSGGEQQRVAIARALVNEPILILADEPTGNLDSRTGREVVLLLESLHRAGKTVLLVTHDTELAGRASRQIRMCDGRIVSDCSTTPSVFLAAGTVGPEMPGPPPAAAEPRKPAPAKRLSNHLRQAALSIFSHKLRAALSTLGVSIGVTAMVAVVAVTRGASESIEQNLTALGSNLLVVHPASRKVGSGGVDTGQSSQFTLEEVNLIARLPAVRFAAGGIGRRGLVEYGNRNRNTTVEGRSVLYSAVYNTRLARGRFFSSAEDASREKVAVLGRTVAEELFGEADPVGETITINRMHFSVIGVLRSRGATVFHDWDDMVIIPLDTARFRLLGERYVRFIEVVVRDGALMDQTQQDIAQLIASRRTGFHSGQKAVHITDMAEIKSLVTGTARTLTWLFASVALISLLVGGVGIMNIMLVSVHERTREIGLRMALGATRSDIMTQFLVEAVVLTLLGGGMGIAAGTAIARILAELAQWPAVLSPLAQCAAVAFSAAVGLVFGLWPARQASRLEPIAALRSE